MYDLHSIDFAYVTIEKNRSRVIFIGDTTTIRLTLIFDIRDNYQLFDHIIAVQLILQDYLKKYNLIRQSFLFDSDMQGMVLSIQCFAKGKRLLHNNLNKKRKISHKKRNTIVLMVEEVVVLSSKDSTSYLRFNNTFRDR